MNVTSFWPFELAAFVFGTAIGSFLNVVIYRLPHGKSIVRPASSCPACGTAIKPWQNVPILSYIYLRGKCAACNEPISLRYPLVEFITGLFCVATFVRYGFHPVLFVEFTFICVLIAITFIDLDTMTIPDVLSLPGIPLAFFGAVLTGKMSWQASLLGLLAGGGSFYLLSFLYQVIRKKEGLGGGDIKLMAMIGAFIGWPGVIFTVMFASLVGSVVGIFLMIKHKNGLATMLPFGPFLAMGAISYLYWGPMFFRWYFSLGLSHY